MVGVPDRDGGGDGNPPILLSLDRSRVPFLRSRRSLPSGGSRVLFLRSRRSLSSVGSRVLFLRSRSLSYDIYLVLLRSWRSRGAFVLFLFSLDRSCGSAGRSLFSLWCLGCSCLSLDRCLVFPLRSLDRSLDCSSISTKSSGPAFRPPCLGFGSRGIGCPLFVHIFSNNFLVLGFPIPSLTVLYEK